MQWFPAVAMLVVGLVLFVASALHVVSFGPVAAQQSAGEAEEQEAVLAALDAGRSSDEAAVDLPLASMPGRAQDEIPIPPHARLIANAAHGDAAAFSINMVLEVPGDVTEVLDFYRDELPLRGWEEVLMWRWRSDDGATAPAGELSAFCRGADGPRFVVAAAPTSPAVSRILIRIDSSTPGPCGVSPPPGVPSFDRDTPGPVF